MHPCPTCGCHVRRAGPCPTCAAPASAPARTTAALLLGLTLAGCGGDATTPTDETTGDTGITIEALYGVTTSDTVEETDDHTGR